MEGCDGPREGQLFYLKKINRDQVCLSKFGIGIASEGWNSIGNWPSTTWSLGTVLMRRED